MYTAVQMRCTCLALLLLACGSPTVDVEPDASDLCGNLVVDPGEECDGTTTATCENADHNAGTPRCTAQCEISYDTCETLTLVAIDHDDDVTCAVTEERGLDCWGTNVGRLAEEPAYDSPLHDIDACGDWGRDAFCGLTGSGEIVCRGSHTPVPQGSGYLSVGCHRQDVWAVSASGNLEFGDPDMTGHYAFIDGSRLAKLIPELECGLYNNGTVICRDPARQAIFADWNATEVSVVKRNTIDGQLFIACGIQMDGSADCVTDGFHAPPDIPATEHAIVEVMPMSLWHLDGAPWGLCILDNSGAVTCGSQVPWLSEPAVHPQWRDMRATWVRCSDPENEECGVTMFAIDTDGNFFSFGDEHGVTEVPGLFETLTSDGGYVFALSENGDVLSIKWYQDPQTQEWTFAPRLAPAIPTYVDVAIAGKFLACALQASGQIDCWGKEAEFHLTGLLEPATELVASQTTICARHPDDTFACIGQAYPPPPIRFRQVSGTSFGRCYYGVDFDGNVHHWGSNPTADCPLPEGRYQLYDAQLQCGITLAGDIDCYGTTLAGPWQDLKRGHGGFCAHGVDGHVKCFARDDDQGVVEIINDTIPDRPVTSIHGNRAIYATLPNHAPHYIRTRDWPSEDTAPPVQLTPWNTAGAKMLATNPYAKGSALCVLNADNRIRCDHGETPLEAPGAISVSRSGYRTCYQTALGETHCYYDDLHETSSLSLALETPLTAAGNGSFCSITDAGYTCFPQTETETFAHLPEQPGAGVLRGGEFGYCFAPQNDVAYCFNGREKIPLTRLDSSLRIVDPGHHGPQEGPEENGIWFMCGISDGDELVCASNPSDVNLPTATPDDPFVDVHVEGWHACAERRSGSYKCFGRYEYLHWFQLPSAQPEWRELPALMDDEELHIGSQTNCVFSPSRGPSCWGRFPL